MRREFYELDLVLLIVKNIQILANYYELPMNLLYRHNIIAFTAKSPNPLISIEPTPLSRKIIAFIAASPNHIQPPTNLIRFRLATASNHEVPYLKVLLTTSIIT